MEAWNQHPRQWYGESGLLRAVSFLSGCCFRTGYGLLIGCCRGNDPISIFAPSATAISRQLITWWLNVRYPESSGSRSGLSTAQAAELDKVFVWMVQWACWIIQLNQGQGSTISDHSCMLVDLERTQCKNLRRTRKGRGQSHFRDKRRGTAVG